MTNPPSPIQEILAVFGSRMQASDEATKMTTAQKFDAAESALLEYIGSVIGEDDPDQVFSHKPYKTHSLKNRIRNQFRRELRQRFGIGK